MMCKAYIFLIAFFFLNEIDTYSQSNHVVKRMLVIRSKYIPLRIEYDGRSYQYSMIDLKYLDSLSIDTTYNDVLSVTHQIIRKYGLYISDNPIDPLAVSCCLFHRHINAGDNLDTIVKVLAERVQRGEGEFLEKKLKRRLYNRYRKKYISDKNNGIYTINYWVADVDFCTCEDKKLGHNGKMTYVNSVSNVQRLDKVNKKKLIFFIKASIR